MLRSGVYSALAVAVSTVACFHSSTEEIRAPGGPEPDTITVGRAFHSVTVERTDDSVTIVFISERGMGVDKVHASYGHGPTYLLWIRRGSTTVINIPWRSRYLRFNRSNGLPVEPGDVIVLRYPEDLTGAGLLGGGRIP